MTQLDPKGRAFPKLTNDCILRAALGEPTEYVPVWIMRQAGRYLPEFRELRSKHGFFEICERPDLACEVTLMPIRRFNLDAAIIFSDILVIPQALGLEVQMLPGQGPHFPNPLKQGEPLESRINESASMAHKLRPVYDAITLARHALEGKCPLIGFSGAPWTLMCYMIEGGGGKTMSKAKRWLYQEPKASSQLLDILAAKVTDHLVEQAKAGAQLLQLFESNAEYLNLEMFTKFAYPRLMKICKDVKQRLADLGITRVPLIVFAKGGHYAMNLLGGKETEGIIDVISLDWTIDSARVREATKLTLQGNLDPCALYSSSSELEVMTKNMLKSFGTQKYIANLGHGIYPDMSMESVKVFVDAVHKISREQNKQV